MNKVMTISLYISGLTLLISSCRLFVLSLIPMFSGFIILFVYLIFLLNLTFNVIYFLINIRKNLTKSFHPLCVNICTVLLSIFIIYFDLERNLNFLMYHSIRQKVIKTLDINKINGRKTVFLKGLDKLASLGGWISITKDKNKFWIEFYSYYSFPGRFEGVIYSSNNQTPPIKTIFNRDDGVYFNKKSIKWYWFDYR